MAAEPTAEPLERRVIFLRALNSALGRSPLWITVSAATALLALVPATMTLGWFREATGQRHEPGSLMAALDEVFRFDTRAGQAALDGSVAAAGGVLALLAMLLGVFSAGGWLQVFLERTHGQSLRRFFYGGSRYFFRFLRVLGLTLLSLHLLGWLLHGAPWDLLVHGWLLGLEDGLEELGSELTARQVIFARDGLFLMGLGLVLLWGDYTRTRLALQDTHSAVWAGLCSWATLIAHPVRALRPLVLLWGVEAAVLAVAGIVAEPLQESLSGGTLVPVLLLFVLGILVVLWRTIVRGARYAAALEVSARLVRPLPRPDPWKQSLGGPGGPRYPLGGDEYSVSL